jgi:hypothetical protein
LILFFDLAIGEELLVQQERLERGMSPVVMDNSISVVGVDATSTSMPVSLASTAKHVALQLQVTSAVHERAGRYCRETKQRRQ